MTLEDRNAGVTSHTLQLRDTCSDCARRVGGILPEALIAHIHEQDSKIQKVSDHVEMSKAATGGDHQIADMWPMS